ncbi:YkvA family protein [Salinimicrobium soli]|uniref:YkvA family protein n=1 Tax=Salinimicrobium soli TaxID=1254399 RepID=UPI003AB08D3B
MKKISPEQATEEMNKKAEKLKEKDLEKVLHKQEKIEDKIRSNDSIKAYIHKAKSMFALLKDYWTGEYKEVPWKTIAAVGGALLYVWMPLDLIPDFIPIAGFLDDAGVIAACLTLVNDDLVTYEKWKVLQNKTEEEES